MSIRKVRAELQKLKDKIATKNPIPEIIIVNEGLNETRAMVCERLGIDPNTEGLVFFHRNPDDDRML